MYEHVYETNPPLSIFIYFPHVIFAKLFSLNIASASYYVSSIFVALSVYLFYRIITCFEYLTHEYKLGLTACYLLSITFTATFYYSDREHLMILGLIPFVLSQFALIQNIKVPRAIWIISCIIGSICVLIKPHYGLLPTIFLFWHIIKYKNFKLHQHADFLALAIFTIIYVGFVFVFFGKFITHILPDVLELYLAPNARLTDVLMLSQNHLMLYTIPIIFEICEKDLKKKQKALMFFFYGCCFLCLIPFFVQMKGFYNHLIPAYAFFMLGFTMSVMLRISTIFSKHTFLCIAVPIVVLASISYAISPLKTTIPTKPEIKTFAVAEFLDTHCEKPCTFFSFHGDIEIMNPTAAQMGYIHGTRFPTYWFLPEILRKLYSDNPEIAQTGTELRKKYAQMALDDLNYFKPSILLLSHGMQIGDLHGFNYIKFFDLENKMSQFIEEHYDKVELFEFDRSDYFKGTTMGTLHMLEYDVYKRKDVNQSLKTNSQEPI